jgi:hypothetical protein
MKCILVAFLVGLIGYDIESGLKAGEKVPEMKAFGLIGDVKDKSVDFVKERGELPTVYLFVKAAKFDRPMARYMKELDQKAGDAADNVQMVAVWVGGDLDDNKKRIPLINQSLKFDRTAMTVFEGDAAGPNGWGLNSDAHLTTIVVHKGKVIKSFAYQSVNDKEVPKVLEELKKAK